MHATLPVLSLCISILSRFVDASPQYMNYASGCRGPTYKTEKAYDATDEQGDHGWLNFNGNLCTAGTSDCQNTQEKSISKTIEINFGGGPQFDLGKALSQGLNFGVAVATTKTETESTSQSCTQSGDDANPCVCGMQYKTDVRRAIGKKIYTGHLCPLEGEEPFDVTSPIMRGKFARTTWRTCRSSISRCDQIKNMPLCADGL